MALTRVAAPLREQVADYLREAIADQRFKPGERLVERDLCELLGVSRTTVREALRQLEAEGLVENDPQHGPTVARVTPEAALEIYQLRAAIEGLASRLAALRATPEELTLLEGAFHALQSAADAGDLVALLAAKDALYDTLFRAAKHSLIAQMHKTLRYRIKMLRAVSLSAEGRTQKSIAEIRAILDAIVRRDPARAEALAIAHVFYACKTALSVLEDVQCDPDEFPCPGITEGNSTQHSTNHDAANSVSNVIEGVSMSEQQSANLFERGLAIRREVLGNEYVDQVLDSLNDFNRDFQQLVTEYCWGWLWGRPTLSRKQRSLNNLCILAVLNRPHELANHIRGALRNGCTVDEIRETLLQVAVYAGIPVGVDAFRTAMKVLKEEGVLP